ncbi:AraC family transcriptional regulator [Streptomyces sp. NPDC051940]|uniref:AraC family transcriptional regulator n=1 Tax=Streptomyces sp. NPDC051940 TaxID=3155675 RepID=UPI00343BDE02
MDTLAGMLEGPRARGAFLMRVTMRPPFSVRVEDHAPLAVCAVVAGESRVRYDEGGPEPVRLTAGDLAIMRGPDPYTVADAPDTPPQVRILPGQECCTLTGEPLKEAMSLGVRSWGNAEDGGTTMLIGAYENPSELGRRLLGALPPLIVLRAGDWDSPLVPLLMAEITRDEPGQSAVLDRLLDLVLISALRQWFARPGGQAPGWYEAQSDPVVGRALRLLHNNPSQPWTVASLATATGVSRAALARRFTDLVGEPPMAYLTGWRLDLAADLLREPDATVGAVARKVGYGTGFALSTAFKRVRGVSPQEHRAAAAA